MNIRIYLYLSYDASHYFRDDFSDAEIEGLIATETGGERVGSGLGFGCRDVEFKIEQPLTQGSINDLARKLQDRFETGFAVSQDAWEDDNDEPLEEYDLAARIES